MPQTDAVARAVHADNVDWMSGTGRLSRGDMRRIIRETARSASRSPLPQCSNRDSTEHKSKSAKNANSVRSERPRQSTHTPSPMKSKPDLGVRKHRSIRRTLNPPTERVRTPVNIPEDDIESTSAESEYPDSSDEKPVLGFVTTSHFNPGGSHLVN
jgi:hypothetical protein